MIKVINFSDLEENPIEAGQTWISEVIDTYPFEVLKIAGKCDSECTMVVKYLSDNISEDLELPKQYEDVTLEIAAALTQLSSTLDV